jgi:hypothetical protein
MRVDPTHLGLPSCEGLLYTCCDGVVQESNPFLKKVILETITIFGIIRKIKSDVG